MEYGLRLLFDYYFQKTEKAEIFRFFYSYRK